MAYRTFLLVDSYLYGFIMQEANFPSDADEMAQLSAFVTSRFPQADYPALLESPRYIMAASPRGRALYDAEFAHGLDLILDGLERIRRNTPASEVAAPATS